MRPDQVRSIGALTILVLAFGLIATTAQAADCQNLTIENGYITSRTGNVETVATALYGPSSLTLQVQTGDQVGLGEGIGTHVILESPNGTATVCPDGSVSFTALPPVEDGSQPEASAPPSPPAEADPMTVAVVLDVGTVTDYDLIHLLTGGGTQE